MRLRASSFGSRAVDLVDAAALHADLQQAALLSVALTGACCSHSRSLLALPTAESFCTACWLGRRAAFDAWAPR